MTKDFKKAIKYDDYRTMRDLVRRYNEQLFPTNCVMRKIEPHAGIVIRIEYDPNITGVRYITSFNIAGKQDSVKLLKALLSKTTKIT